MNPEWQARFNKLLEKPGSGPAPAVSLQATSVAPSSVPAKRGALAPAALSKASLDVRGGASRATVSLPNASQHRSFASDFGRDAVTRKGAEALFEDREFGSLPTVKLSKVPYLAAAEPAVDPPKDDPHPRFKRFENPFTIRRLEAFDFEKLAQKIDVVVYLPSMREAITKSMPRKRRGPKNNGHFKSKTNNVPNGPSASSPKDRPRKPSQQSQTDVSSSSRPAAPNAWASNPRTSQAHQATTWARRAAASAH